MVRDCGCPCLGPVIHSTYSGLGWPQKPPGPRALALPCHLMFPWSCADTGSFTLSMGRWSSKIRSSVRKSASLNTDAPVWFAESLEAQVEEGSRRRCTGQRGYLAPQRDLSNPRFAFLFLPRFYLLVSRWIPGLSAECKKKVSSPGKPGWMGRYSFIWTSRVLYKITNNANSCYCLNPQGGTIVCI